MAASAAAYLDDLRYGFDGIDGEWRRAARPASAR
jgi:hypothetical protein